MILAWSTSRRTTYQTPPHATLVLVPLSLLLNSAKVHHRLQECLFLSFCFLTCLFLFRFPFHPRHLQQLHANVVLFYPCVTFPFKNCKSFVSSSSSSSSSSSPCPKILHSHFAHYYCLLQFFFNLSFFIFYFVANFWE